MQEIVMLGEGAFIIAGQLFKVGEVGALVSKKTENIEVGVLVAVSGRHDFRHRRSRARDESSADSVEAA
jgi:hypothetical protein